MERTQEEKAARLQWAVLNSSVEELSKIYDELGFVEMSAPALGLACRFRGLDAVKCLVQAGASFDFPSTGKVEETYNCYIGKKYGNYRTNYSMYLLKAFGDDLKLFCLKGMTMEQTAQREDGDTLSFLPDAERVKVLEYLLENEVRQKTAFHPEELLYYAIYCRDTALVEVLRKHDIKISETRINIIADGAQAMNGYWFEYILLTQRLADEDYLAVMQQLAADFDGRLFHFTENVYEVAREHFHDVSVVEFFLSHFKKERMNKKEIMCGLIDKGNAGAFPLLEREGWLAQPRKRDEMIAYASEKGATEVLAWLLEYKNRTADFAAEQEKADRKLMRELNRKPSLAPSTVAALKKIWTYHKREDGTLVVTNYKGTDSEVVVPEKIGKGTVTAIGDGAFAGANYCSYNVMASVEHIRQHSRITAVTLPDTIESVGESAFWRMDMLERVNIPAGVQEIGANAFERCKALKSIAFPDGIKEISPHIFENCSGLQDITIPGTVREIGTYAFLQCSALKKITIPGNVEKICMCAFNRCINLQKVELCEGVRAIGEYAFFTCHSLSKITIPSTVEKVSTYAFADCRSLGAACISEGVRSIDAYAFADCVSLRRITVPETVEEIGKGAFEGCRQLEEVCLCGEIKKIGSGVFADCARLRLIRAQKPIPNRILGEAFEQHPELTVACPKGSKTEAYCKKKGIPFKDIDESY